MNKKINEKIATYAAIGLLIIIFLQIVTTFLNNKKLYSTFNINYNYEQTIGFSTRPNSWIFRG